VKNTKLERSTIVLLARDRYRQPGCELQRGDTVAHSDGAVAVDGRTGTRPHTRPPSRRRVRSTRTPSVTERVPFWSASPHSSGRGGTRARVGSERDDQYEKYQRHPSHCSGLAAGAET
jgi:hypothetical protein